MKKKYLLYLLCTIVLGACTQQKKQTSKTDYGEVKDSVYHYSDLKLTIPILQEWIQPTAKTYERIRSATPTTTKLLLLISQYDLEKKQDGFNSNVVVMVEDLSQQERVKTATDYLQLTRKTLQENEQLHLRLRTPLLHTIASGKQQLQVMKIDYMTDDQKQRLNFSQAFYSTIIHSKALTILVSYHNDSTLQLIENKMIKNIIFEK